MDKKRNMLLQLLILSSLLSLSCQKEEPVEEVPKKEIVEEPGNESEETQGGLIRPSDTSCSSSGTSLGTPEFFLSPNYPSNYNNNDNCSWVITADSGERVKISTGDFDTVPVADHLELFDGNTESDALRLLNIDGDRGPMTFVSPGRVLRARFVTSNSNTNPGFNFSVTSTTDTGDCSINGRTLSQDPGTFQSYFYAPGNRDYMNSQTCAWIIESPDPSKRVKLIINTFQLEPFWDHLNLYHSSIASSNRFSALEGTYSSGTEFVSPGSKLVAQFTTDGSVVRDGFRISYVFTAEEPACNQLGNSRTTAPGTISSVHYPNRYSARSNCAWIIDSNRTGEFLRFTILNMDIGSDDITFRASTDFSANQIARFTGSGRNQSILVAGHSRVIVRFTSGNAGRAPGFLLHYEYTNDREMACSPLGVTFTAQSGTIRSPNHPGQYFVNQNCLYIIQAGADQTIALSVDSYNLETGFDYLRVYVGNDTTAANLELELTNTGGNLIFNVTNATEIQIRFTSDSSVLRNAGFSLSYTLVGSCAAKEGGLAKSGAKCKACLSMASMVQTRGGGLKRLSALSVGEEVLAFDTHQNLVTYSPILALVHHLPEHETDMVEIISTDGQDKRSTMTLSPNHLIYVQQQNGGGMKSVFGGAVQVGDVIYQATAGELLAAGRVLEVRRLVKTGISSPMTSVGTIIADGVLASCYSSYNQPRGMHLVFMVYKMLMEQARAYMPTAVLTGLEQSLEHVGSYRRAIEHATNFF